MSLEPRDRKAIREFVKNWTQTLNRYPEPTRASAIPIAEWRGPRGKQKIFFYAPKNKLEKEVHRYIKQLLARKVVPDRIRHRGRYAE